MHFPPVWGLGVWGFWPPLVKISLFQSGNATITSVDVDVLCLPGARLIFSLSLDVWPLGWGKITVAFSNLVTYITIEKIIDMWGFWSSEVYVGGAGAPSKIAVLISFNFIAQYPS